MNIFNKTLLLFTLSLCSFFFSKAQCSYVIPADVHVISIDSSINNSFLPAQKFLICPGSTLTVYGNSTGFNKFYLESGAAVIFSDSMGATPYGMYSFYAKSGSTVHYNASSNVAFPFLDTLVWEPGATLIDTGGLFNYDSLCSSLIFDYSLIGGAPCSGTNSDNLKLTQNFSITPIPFSNELNIYFANTFSESEVIFYDLSGRILEQFILSDEASNSIKLKNNWSGVSIMEFKNKNGESHFEKVIRY